MYNPQYLTQSRHGVYYLRFPIASFLHPEHRQSAIRLSLRTRCPSEALHMSRALCYVGEQLIREGASSMDYQDIREVLFDHFKAMREQMKARINSQGRLSEPDVAALQNNRERASTALASQNYEQVGTEVQLASVLEESSLDIKQDSKDYETFRTEYLQAYRDYCGSVLEYDSRFNQYDFSTKPEVLAVKEATKASRRKKLADAIEGYCAEKLRLGQWRPATADEYRSKFHLLQRYLGEDAQLNISPETAVDVKHMLSQIPSNASKKYQGMSIAELMQQEDKKLSPVTVNKHLQAYSALYGWAVKRKEVQENHFNDLMDDVSKAKQKRKSFEREEVQRILDAVMKEDKKLFRKWGVLLAFYTGARLNEIAQLNVSEIQELDGLWCVCFTDEAEQQRLKNEASKRIIPLHPVLLELGFLKYVQSLRKDGRLFPDLTYCKVNGYGRNLGRWFNENLLDKQLGLTSSGLVFHSIRHTVAQELRNKGVQTSVTQAIIGHASNEVVNKVYAPELDRKLMLDALSKLDYGYVEAHTAAT